MSDDPRRVYNAMPEKHRTLKALWPELYNAFEAIGESRPARVTYCVIGDCPSARPQHQAVARLQRDGHPACARHVQEFADRPGGWPLQRGSRC